MHVAIARWIFLAAYCVRSICCSTHPVTINGDKWTHTSNSKGESKWSLKVYCRDGEYKSLLKIWKYAMLKLDIAANASYELFEDESAERVELMFNEHRKSWFHFWPGQTTEISMNPFNRTCIGVATAQLYTISAENKAVYSLYAVSTVCSILLFYAAKRLSKNIGFYYGTGVSIGMVASVLILLFILSRLIPGKKAGLVFMTMGGSVFMAAAQYIWRTQVLSLLEEHYSIVIAYLVCSGLLSFALLYWYGPPSSSRTLDIVQWAIQLIALAMLYYSIQVREVAVAAMVMLLCVYNFPVSILGRIRLLWMIRFPPKRKLLSLDEYEQEANEYTRKSLEQLRDFCKSPKCDAWKTISRLNTPTRFADFVEGSSHLQDDELLAYDAGDAPMVTPVTSDTDSDDEIDFHLSTR